MSGTHVVVVSPDVRRTTVKVTPGTYMIDVLEEACKKFNLPSDKWALKHQKTEVVLTNPFRMTGLTGGAKLELVQKSSSPSVVNIALNLPEQEAKNLGASRVTNKFRSDTTLWKVLRYFETNGDPQGRSLNFTARGVPKTSHGKEAGSGVLYHETPVLRILGREVSSLVDFQRTLSQMGMTSGSHALQLAFATSDKTLSDAMMEISQFFKENEDPRWGSKVESSQEAPQATREEPEPAQAFEGELDQQPSAANDGLVQSQLATPDLMTIDHSPAPTDPLQPVGVFSAPTSSTPAAVADLDPDSVFVPTIAHAQLHQQRLQQDSYNKRLKSDAELEEIAKAEEAKIAAVKTVRIRVRFPDETSAQWTMGPDATGATLYSAVRGLMANDTVPFKLILPGGSGKIQDDSSKRYSLIRGYKMSGRVLVNLLWDNDVAADVRKKPFLKDSVASQAQKIEVPKIPSVTEDVDDKPGSTVQAAKPEKKPSAGEVTRQKISKFFKLPPGKK